MWPLIEFTRCKNKTIKLPFVTWNKISLPICLLLTHELHVLQNAKLTGHHYTQTTQCIIHNCHNPLQTKNHKPVTYMSVFIIQSPKSLWSVTNVRACEPEPEPRVASLFLQATAFFSYLFIFWHFQFNVNVFLSKWFTLQKKHKFSIFFCAWNSAQAVAVVSW